MFRVYIAIAAFAGFLWSPCRAELASGNRVGFVNLELQPGINQYHTYMNDLGGGTFKIDSLLRFAEEGDVVIYDFDGEMRPAVAVREGDDLLWVDSELRTKLHGARLPGDESGSDLIYRSGSPEVKEISLAGESVQFHDPKPANILPPPPKVVKLALPFKTRPIGRFCMLVKKGESSTERMVVRLSDANTIIHADSGEEVRCREQDIIGFEEFVPAENPLSEPQVNMSKRGVDFLNLVRNLTAWQKKKILEIASMLKGGEVTWSALCSSAVIVAITAVFSRLVLFALKQLGRLLWFLFVRFLLVSFLWEKCRLNALPWLFWRFVRWLSKAKIPNS